MFYNVLKARNGLPGAWPPCRRAGRSLKACITITASPLPLGAAAWFGGGGRGGPGDVRRMSANVPECPRMSIARGGGMLARPRWPGRASACRVGPRGPKKGGKGYERVRKRIPRGRGASPSSAALRPGAAAAWAGGPLRLGSRLRPATSSDVGECRQMSVNVGECRSSPGEGVPQGALPGLEKESRRDRKGEKRIERDRESRVR